MDIKIYAPRNPRNLRETKKNTAPERFIPKEYRNVAKGMEQRFAEFMIKQMEKTTGRTDHSVAGDYYNSLLASERAKILTETNGGLGTQEMILNQIYPHKSAPQKGQKKYAKQNIKLKGDNYE